jgi:hypothetical protein
LTDLQLVPQFDANFVRHFEIDAASPLATVLKILALINSKSSFTKRKETVMPQEAALLAKKMFL